MNTCLFQFRDKYLLYPENKCWWSSPECHILTKTNAASISPADSLPLSLSISPSIPLYIPLVVSLFASMSLSPSYCFHPSVSVSLAVYLYHFLPLCFFIPVSATSLSFCLSLSLALFLSLSPSRCPSLSIAHSRSLMYTYLSVLIGSPLFISSLHSPWPY